MRSPNDISLWRNSTTRMKSHEELAASIGREKKRRNTQKPSTFYEVEDIRVLRIVSFPISVFKLEKISWDLLLEERRKGRETYFRQQGDHLEIFSTPKKKVY